MMNGVPTVAPVPESYTCAASEEPDFHVSNMRFAPRETRCGSCAEPAVVMVLSEAPVDSCWVSQTIPAMTVEWVSILAFNDVLKQMPNGSSADETKVLLTTLALDSTEVLDFVATVDVFINRGGKADALVSTPPTAMDGGVAVEARSGALPCEIAGGKLSVAHFQAADETPVGVHLPLGLLAPELNLFNCVKDDPTEFHVTMGFRPGRHPERTTPLTLSTCVSSESHMGFP